MNYLILFFLLLLSCLMVGCETSQLSLVGINLTTDKPIYHSGEIIHIAAEINSPLELSNTTIRFYGIYSGSYRLDETKFVDLNEGVNNITLDYNAPRCYGCSGISPGIYQINADLKYNGEMLMNNSVDVEIQQ